LAVAVLGPKRLEVLRDVVPKAAVIGLLVNPTNVNAELNIKDALAAVKALGQKLVVVRASADRDFEAAFDTLSQEAVGALSIDPDALFLDWRQQIVALAAQYALAAVYPLREFAVSGGLMSYGTNVADAYRRVGVYVARILKGEKAADLPVQQSDKVELVINLMIANLLGLTIPPTLLARADEVIE